jgi:hypothetical protein
LTPFIDWASRRSQIQFKFAAPANLTSNPTPSSISPMFARIADFLTFIQIFWITETR